MLPSLRVQSWCGYLFLTLMKCLHLLFSAAMKVLHKDEPEIAAVSSWRNGPYVCNSRMFVFTGTILLALAIKLITLRNGFQSYEQVRITSFPTATQMKDIIFSLFSFFCSGITCHVFHYMPFTS